MIIAMIVKKCKLKTVGCYTTIHFNEPATFKKKRHKNHDASKIVRDVNDRRKVTELMS